jgi:hypothetical protein
MLMRKEKIKRIKEVSLYCSSSRTLQKPDLEADIAAPRPKPLVLGRTAWPKTSGFRRGASSSVLFFGWEEMRKDNAKRNFSKSDIQTAARRLKPVVLGEGLPALFLYFVRKEMRKENRKRKERAEIASVIFLEDSGPETGFQARKWRRRG